jgi:transposase-like protein
MIKSDIQNPAFTDEEQAREALEGIRWPDGPYCPHCGNADQDKIAKGEGKAHRPGLYYCAACNGQFTVTVWELGTLATDNIVRHSRRAEITTLHEVLWMRPRVPPTPPR